VKSLAGQTAIVGVGETRYYKQGTSPDPEFKLALLAILEAIDDAGLKITDIDGFSSFYHERATAHRLATALGLPELRMASLAWEGGHAGAALAHAASAVHSGLANYVVVFRSLAQGEFGRLGQYQVDGLRANKPKVSFPTSHWVPYGAIAPGQLRAGLRANRYLYTHNIGPDTLKAISMATYFHAQQNPRALMHGKPLTDEGYESSRWIVEPLRLVDYCQENDCAVALIVTTRERADDLRQRPAYIRAVSHGSDYRQADPVNQFNFATSNFAAVGRRLFEMAGTTPAAVDNAQLYDNFTIAVLMTLSELGFCNPEELNDFATFEHLTAPDGRLPINTAGGNIAEGYGHGLQLIVESVRQIRGTSTNQVPDAALSLFTSAALGPVTGAGLISRS